MTDAGGTLDLELLDRLDRALVFLFEEMTRRTPGGRVVHRDGLSLVIGTDPSPVIVNTILTVAPAIDIDALPAAFAEYERIGSMASLMTRDHRDGPLVEGMTARQYRRLIELPAMVVDRRLPNEPPPAGVVIHRVETEADRRRWIEGNLHGFGEDEADRAAMLSAFSTLDSLIGGGVTGWWAEADGRGVAAAMAGVHDETGVGVVGWVGTDVAYRGRGIGRAISLAATNAAFDLGAELVSLQASPMGFPVYQRLGYRTVGGYQVWLAPGGGH